jgi:hypothetical protein
MAYEKAETFCEENGLLNKHFSSVFYLDIATTIRSEEINRTIKLLLFDLLARE